MMFLASNSLHNLRGDHAHVITQGIWNKQNWRCGMNWTYKNLMYIPQIESNTMHHTLKYLVNKTLFEKYVDP